MSDAPIATIDQHRLGRVLRAMVIDALDQAAGLAQRAQEATEGDDLTLAFEEVRNAISQFKLSHPAMVALGSVVLRDMK